MKNITFRLLGLCLFFVFQYSAHSQGQDINVQGGSGPVNIPNGDTSPTTTKGNDFGNVEIGDGSQANAFVIQNTYPNGNPSDNILSITSITVSGTNASEFVVTSSITTVERSNQDTFNVTFTPTAVGLRTATITIASDDPDENPWTFDVQGTGILPLPEMNITGQGVSITDGDTTPITTDDTSWGSVETNTTTTHTFTIQNTANAASTLTLSNAGSGISITDASGYFTINTEPTQNTTISGNSSTTFSIDFSPLADGTFTATVSIDNDDSDENPYNFNITGTSYTPAPEIAIIGSASLVIVDGDTTPSDTDGTNFGSINVGSDVQRTFTIDNTAGTSDLNITSIGLSNTTDFAITGTTYSSPVSAGASTTFSITYSALTDGVKTCTVTVNNDDSDEGTYTFDIEGTGVQLFYDSDNDGIFDNLDIDDDNDGVPDTNEELSCNTTSVSYQVNYKFLEETFGTGPRTTINTTYDAIASYCYEDGTAGTNTAECTSLSSMDLNDGEYVVYHKACNGDGTNQTPVDEVASWADQYWYTGDDHTPGDTNGRMAMFNASYDPGTFYTAHIKGALPGVPVTYSFWVINLDRTDAPCVDGGSGCSGPGSNGSRLRPDIQVEFQDMSGNTLTNQDTMLPAIITTGDIPPTSASNPDGDWYNFTADLVLGVNEFQVIFTNNQSGGLGNDLALDDIEIRQTLCDLDNDGVADLFDLDDDNDGIPDIVEVGLGSLSNGTGRLDAVWVDSNGNGLHDSAEGNTILDSDGDGVPNYHDLDSDNDGIFDVDESGAGNTGNSQFQNGDGDIDGDGVGDGPESEAFREKDVYGTGIPDYYGDGILDIYDFHSSGNSYANAYGNANQGTVTGTVYFVKDTDLDGIPDYIDTDSDGDGIYDIAGTLYASLDANNDGVIDDTNDSDGDGLLDLFDTDDSAFGSPRDLDIKLQLYFDGRNDYAEDTNVIDGWGEATLMAWIKVDTSATGTQIIVGQDQFHLQLNSNKSITANGAGYTVTNGAAIPTNQWVHIGATYSNTSSELILYINGSAVSSTSISGNLGTDTSSFTLGRQPDTDNNYFHGYLDEVRVFDKALSENEFQKMVYQEIEENSGTTRGAIIPLDVTDFVDEATVTPLPWTNLQRYFRMDVYKDDIIDDLTTSSTDTGTGAKIYNTKLINYQTAPLPFVTQQSGDLATAVDISADGVNGNDAVTYDWSIVQVKHDNVTYGSDQKHLGLIIDEEDASSNPITFKVQNDSELNVSWYLKLDGKIDLEDESQLVQGAESELDVTSKGTIEKDQQGTRDLYTYNYWSAPVGISNITSNNNSYALPSIFKDGTTPSTPVNINFITSGYDGTSGSPIGIADYWIWKYSNEIGNTYSAWEHVRSTGTMNAGEGFTMKGVANTSGNIVLEQNYVFDGKPNNGDITLPLSVNNQSLVGNPYPSAIDADAFILDNIGTADGGTASGNVINGVIYFWDHFASGTHVLAGYQGGYASYTLMGGAPAICNDTRINATGGIGTKIPERHVPVGQGFFVSAIDDTNGGLSNPIVGGNIVFKNSQRIFQTEQVTGSNGGSVFLKSNGSSYDTLTDLATQGSNPTVDTREKIRLEFDSPKGYHRHLLIGVDNNTTMGHDIGYDAPLIETNPEDMFWYFGNMKYTIQGVDNFEVNQILPLGVKTTQDGNATFKIHSLENIAPTKDIYLHDKDLNIYHDLKNSNYTVNLVAGNYLNRFEITFNNGSTLSMNENALESLEVYYSNDDEGIIINNPKGLNLKSAEMFTILGQSLLRIEEFENVTSEIKTQPLATGTYIIDLKTQDGYVVSKKVLVN